LITFLSKSNSFFISLYHLFGEYIIYTKWEVVTFVALRQDSLIVSADSKDDGGWFSFGQDHPISLSSITRLDVARGQKSAVGKGALWGALIGAVAGAVAGAGVEKGIGFGDAPSAVFAGVRVLAGGAAGALIGISIKTERWKKVPLDQLQMGIVSQRDGRFGLGVLIRF